MRRLATEFTRRIKIYGTDLDKAALNAARHTSYLPRDPGPSLHTRLLDVVVDSSPSAYVAIDNDDMLVFASAGARRMLEVGDSDVGRPFQDLSVSYRPVSPRPWRPPTEVPCASGTAGHDNRSNQGAVILMEDHVTASGV
jgi:hypothetical protein